MKIIVLIITAFFMLSFVPSESDLKKTRQLLSKLYESGDVRIVQQDGNYQIVKEKENIGKLYFREVTPKVETFKYLVVVDAKGEILKLSILDYPSMHGVGMINKRWLDKFIGMNIKKVDPAKVEIDAVSGGTLSLKALVNDLQQLDN